MLTLKLKEKNEGNFFVGVGLVFEGRIRKHFFLMEASGSGPTQPGYATLRWRRDRLASNKEKCGELDEADIARPFSYLNIHILKVARF